MEDKTNDIVEMLKLTDAEEEKSFSMFDHNDKILYEIGKPKITERDAIQIRQFIASSWRNPVRIRVGKSHYLCIKVTNVILGKGNFNTNLLNSSLNCENNKYVTKDTLEGRKDPKKTLMATEETFTLAATLVGKFTIVLMGRTVIGESIMEQIKQVSTILGNTYNQISDTNSSNKVWNSLCANLVQI